MLDEEEVVSIKVLGLGRDLRFVRSPHEEFWKLFDAGTWEPETLALLTAHLRPGSKYVDIGAWIGPTSLVAAATGADVLAFEPDPIARGYLERNVKLNEDLVASIEVVPAALSRRDGSATLSSATLGDSSSSLVRKTNSCVDVRTLDIRTWAQTEAFTTSDMVKIDVEGAEYSIIPALSLAFKHHRSTVLLSVHGYVIRDRFETLPSMLARVSTRSVSFLSRMRLMYALRRFEYKREYLPGTGEWVPLRGWALSRFLRETRNTEILLSSVDIAAAPTAP